MHKKELAKAIGELFIERYLQLLKEAGEREKQRTAV